MNYQKLKEEIQKYIILNDQVNTKYVFTAKELENLIDETVSEQQEELGKGENPLSIVFLNGDYNSAPMEAENLKNIAKENGIYGSYDDNIGEAIVYFDSKVSDIVNLYVNIKRTYIFSLWAELENRGEMDFESFYAYILEQDYPQIDLICSLEAFNIFSKSNQGRNECKVIGRRT